MAILEKEVLVRLAGSNIKHFEKLGYEIPRVKVNGKLTVKQRTKILVSVNDLQKNSGQKVTKVCDECGKKVINQQYGMILKLRKKGNGHDRCNDCGNQITVKKRIENVKFERTLEYWAAKNNREYLLKEFSIKNKKRPDKIFKSSTTLYLWNCFNCNGEYTMSVNQRTEGEANCPYCAGRRVLIGYNDLWTTHPEIAQMLVNIQDGYEITAGSGKKKKFKCSDCGYIFGDKTVSDIVNQGIICKRCGDGFSFPEKVLFNVLYQLGIDFQTQKKFTWSNGKKYDFYIPEKNMIIETHGAQHYYGGFERGKGRSLEEEIVNDILKEKLANENCIEEYIILDCRHSDLNYIKNSVYSSQISIYFDLKTIDWIRCYEYSCKSLVKESSALWNNGIKNTFEIGKILNVYRSTIIKYLKQGAEIGWCSYNARDEFLKSVRNNNKKAIVQLTKDTKIVKEWESIAEASNNLNIGASHISGVCLNKRITAGGFKWMYLKEYEDKFGKVLITK